MARSTRQSKILEIISIKEIETQDELVAQLRAANFEITQATISRDIKELGLIKILSAETGKYKYAIVENGEQAVSNKYINIIKESIISIKPAQNLCVIKTIKGMANALCDMIDKINIDGVMGSVSGNDTMMLIFPTNEECFAACRSLSDMLC